MSKHKTIKKSLIALTVLAVLGFIANFVVTKRLEQYANG